MYHLFQIMYFLLINYKVCLLASLSCIMADKIESVQALENKISALLKERDTILRENERVTGVAHNFKFLYDTYHVRSIWVIKLTLCVTVIGQF